MLLKQFIVTFIFVLLIVSNYRFGSNRIFSFNIARRVVKDLKDLWKPPKQTREQVLIFSLPPPPPLLPSTSYFFFFFIYISDDLWKPENQIL
jgi:hypothetical protein